MVHLCKLLKNSVLNLQLTFVQKLQGLGIVVIKQINLCTKVTSLGIVVIKQSVGF